MSKIRASGLKRRLYCRVSALVLAAAGCAGAAAAQPGAGGFWIDLSGGYNFDAGGALDTFPSDTLAGPQRVRPRADWDIDGKIGYQASGSPWVVDLGVKYGRTFKRSRSFSGSTPGYYYGYPYAQSARSSTNVTHTVVDFEVGRDVGMGAAGPTTLGLGVRYAHFDASTRGTFSTSSKYFSTSGSFSVGRRTNVVGPRIWIRSAIPLGASNFSVGWGGGAAVLFGSENVTEDAAYADGSTPFHAYRSNSATVPNVDGYLKLNFHEPNSPVTISAGYRVDAYFNAMDGGWDTERKVDIIEHGPFLEMIWKIQ